MKIDDTIKEYFRRGTKLCYENDAEMPMTEAFSQILTLFFHQGKRSCADGAPFRMKKDSMDYTVEERSQERKRFSH